MEILKFTIDDSKIAELLGRQNFSTKESAVFELVKNCFDAESKSCDIYIENNYIKIVDSGDGMNLEDIKVKWMHVGSSEKGYKNENSNRVLTGSKGVGRFALARLGNKTSVTSKKTFEEGVIWETNWIESTLKMVDRNSNKGTIIEIFDLRDAWRKKDVDKLIDFLSRSYKSNDMVITIHFEGEAQIIYPVFNNLMLGVNYSTKIILNYDNKNTELTVIVESDEFKQEASKLIYPLSTNYFKEVFNMKYELKTGIPIEDLSNYLTELGDFNAELYFGLDRTSVDSMEKYMYKYNVLTSESTGIILNRNDFSISSYEGVKDWLDLASRSSKSPAAATHPTGGWRVRKNQIKGYVTIDKYKNKNLKDMANRQGLEEDEYYDLFREILVFGINRFEKFRQNIIRKIDVNQKKSRKKDESIKKEAKKKLTDFLKKPLTATKMSQEELSLLANEIIHIQEEAKEQVREKKENEQQHKYDVRILNVLATQGLRASAIAHELHNKRNILDTGYKDVIDALKEFGLWEELNSEEHTRVSYKNVPKILGNLEEINLKLMAFLDIILNKIEKEKFNSKIISLEDTIEKIINTWSQQYKWLSFQTSIKNEMLEGYSISNDVLEVIFDNLIINSIQHNEMKDLLSISIEVELSDDYLNLKYSDNGVGLHQKYKDEPKRILEVHETSRNDGHGLGMWIVNNTLHMYGGKVIDIQGNNGFSVYFNLKG